MNIIETINLNCRFGRTEAVRDLTLEVPEGSVYAFLGPNGAGKTTTIKMLLNILRPTGGEARVFGLASTGLGPPELAQIGYVSENQQLPEWMTVAQLLAYCRPFYPTWDDAFCRKLLADFELPADRKLRSLSRGMKVKAALVSSLAYRPRLLVRDEFIRGILELAEQDGWTIFVSSHDIDEVERLADHVGVIDRGHLQLSETTESLQARFRRVDFAVEQPPERWPAATPPPPSWLVTDIAGHRVRFVESQYRPGETEREIRDRFPGASEPLIEPLSLREIFLTLARTFRFQAEV
jgi:ABC-2 type transport system ATP-binding protein